MLTTILIAVSKFIFKALIITEYLRLWYIQAFTSLFASRFVRYNRTFRTSATSFGSDDKFASIFL